MDRLVIVELWFAVGILLISVIALIWKVEGLKRTLDAEDHRIWNEYCARCGYYSDMFAKHAERLDRLEEWAENGIPQPYAFDPEDYS